MIFIWATHQNIIWDMGAKGFPILKFPIDHDSPTFFRKVAIVIICGTVVTLLDDQGNSCALSHDTEVDQIRQ